MSAYGLQSDVHTLADGSPVAVFRYVTEQGWGDGLPVIPPTAELVAEMVEASGRPAQSVVARIPPNDGPATIEKIAVNAVMAGCLPQYMPVVVAAIEACADPS